MSNPTASRERELLVWLRSRNVALTLYGFMGIQVGLATALTGAGPLLEDRFGPMVRILIGGLAFIGGVLTFSGSIHGDRKLSGWWSALVGSVMLAIWAAAGFAAFVSVTLDTGIDVAWPWQAISPDVARLATPLFYESIFLLICLHVLTLIQLGRPSKR